MEPELMTECADWIAEQMEEDGMMVDAGLIEIVLETEQRVPIRIPQASHPQAAAAVAVQLAADGVRGAPDAIDERLVLAILEWEDEFLAFAGRPRRRA